MAVVLGSGIELLLNQVSQAFGLHHLLAKTHGSPVYLVSELLKCPRELQPLIHWFLYLHFLILLQLVVVPHFWDAEDALEACVEVAVKPAVLQPKHSQSVIVSQSLVLDDNAFVLGRPPGFNFLRGLVDLGIILSQPFAVSLVQVH